MKKILVIGGNGKTGRRVLSRLTKLNHEVRNGSRSTYPSFDWNNQSTWDKALHGMEAVYITYQPDLAVTGAVETIKLFTEHAKKNDIKKLVLLSGRGEKEAQACENIVMNSGIDSTVVRASWFNQNFSESFFLEPILAGHVALPVNGVKEPFIDSDDIADVVVESLLNEEHSGQIYEITGPELLTFTDVVGIISKETGREIQFHPITMEEYEAMMKEHQIPDDYIWLIKYLFTEVLDGRNESTTDTIEKVLGRKPKSFSEYVAETVKTKIWNN